MIQVHSCSTNLSVVLLLCCNVITYISQGLDVLNLPRLAHRKLTLPQARFSVLNSGSNKFRCAEYHKDDCHMYIAGDGLEQVPCMLQATS